MRSFQGIIFIMYLNIRGDFQIYISVPLGNQARITSLENQLLFA